jgi:Kef-type K+ transport system membrane component KefB
MQYFLKPLFRAMANMNDEELLASIVLGILLFLAVVLEIVNH